jgi:RNA polymerase sigma factor (sigma-70 family)
VTGPGDGCDAAAVATSPLPALHHHLALVRHLAARLLPWFRPYVELDDLVAVGVEALLRSAERYDPARGTSLGTFAYRRVRGAMCEAVGAVGPFSRGVTRRRRDRPTRASPSFIMLRLDDERLGAAAAELVDDDLTGAVDRALLLPRLVQAIDRLRELDRKIIVRHYVDGDSLATIGRDLGRSRSWVARKHAIALARLRTALEPVPR